MVREDSHYQAFCVSLVFLCDSLRAPRETICYPNGRHDGFRQTEVMATHVDVINNKPPFGGLKLTTIDVLRFAGTKADECGEAEDLFNCS
jgi:hypothetical protein